MANNPIITPKNVVIAISSFLKSLFGQDMKVYVSPNVQDTELPCFFINFIPVTGIGNLQVGEEFYLMKYMVDISYVRQQNEPNLYLTYMDTMSILDVNFPFIPFKYTDDSGVEHTVPVRTYEREYKINRDALHYQFKLELQTYLTNDNEANLIESYEREIDVQMVGDDGLPIYPEPPEREKARLYIEPKRIELSVGEESRVYASFSEYFPYEKTYGWYVINPPDAPYPGIVGIYISGRITAFNVGTCEIVVRHPYNPDDVEEDYCIVTVTE